MQIDLTARCQRWARAMRHCRIIIIVKRNDIVIQVQEYAREKSGGR